MCTRMYFTQKGCSSHRKCRIERLEITKEDLRAGIQTIEIIIQKTEFYLEHVMKASEKRLEDFRKEINPAFEGLKKEIEENLDHEWRYKELEGILREFEGSCEDSPVFREVTRHCFLRFSDQNIPKCENEEEESKEENDQDYITVLESDKALESLHKDYLSTKENYKLNLDFDLHKIHILCESLKDTKIPSLKKLSLANIHLYGSLASSFLKNCFPQKVELLTIDRNEISNSQISRFMPELSNCLKNVTREVFIRGYKLREEDLISIVKSCAQTSRLKLFDCEIDTPKDFKFPEGDYKIKVLDLERCGKYSSWGTKPNKLSNILKAIQGCGLRESLQEIAASDVDIEIEEIKDMVDKLSMGSIQITNNAPWDADD